MKRLLCWLVVLMVLPLRLIAWQPQTLLIFGDSLSDNGNKYAVYHIPISPPYWHGRYSDGPVWAEYLAYAYHLIPNPAQHPDYNRRGHFLDFAFGEAVAAKQNVLRNVPTRTLLQQLATMQRQQPTLGPKSLLVLWDWRQ